MVGSSPSSLFVVPANWVARCRRERRYDVRHLGRDLIYEYECPRCGPRRYVAYGADYPYCGPNSVATCDVCYAVMRLSSTRPVIGTPRLTPPTVVRGSV